jgi:hypothetical protein
MKDENIVIQCCPTGWWFLPDWLGQNRGKTIFPEKHNRLEVFARLVGPKQIQTKISEVPNRLKVFAQPVGETQNFCDFFSRQEASTHVHLWSFRPKIENVEQLRDIKGGQINNQLHQTIHQFIDHKIKLKQTHLWGRTWLKWNWVSSFKYMQLIMKIQLERVVFVFLPQDWASNTKARHFEIPKLFITFLCFRARKDGVSDTSWREEGGSLVNLVRGLMGSGVWELGRVLMEERRKKKRGRGRDWFLSLSFPTLSPK